MRYRLLILVALLGSPGLGAPEPPRSPLAPPPAWERLQGYSKTISRERFAALLHRVYAPGRSAAGLIEIRDNDAIVKTSGDAVTSVRFHLSGGEALPPPRFWRPRAALRRRSPEKPLQGVHIALDPGHIGGRFAVMEERWYRLGSSRPVTEGDMTLTTARLLRPQLEALGARVTLVRSRPAPVISKRPEDFFPQARSELARLGVLDPRPRYDSSEAPGTRWNSLQWQGEKLFYRTGEIRARADRVNRRLKPDLVVCLHFNAEPWGDPSAPELLAENHLHVLVNGTYSPAELRLEDQRFEMLLRILQGTYDEEAGIADAVATAMARRTGLPAYVYPTENARRVTRNPYLYARNLLANRLYECPVVFLEPYVMNNKDVFQRVQAGHYEGSKVVNGRKRESIYAEYAAGVRDGLVRYYRPGP